MTLCLYWRVWGGSVVHVHVEECVGQNRALGDSVGKEKLENSVDNQINTAWNNPMLNSILTIRNNAAKVIPC